MGIVLKWNFKTLFADIPRLVLTLLSVAGAFLTLTAGGLTVESQMRILGSLNRGLPFYILLILQTVTLTLFAFTMYLLFSTSLEERRAPYALLRSVGATVRQTVWSLLAQAAALDLIGALVGVGAGFPAAAGILRANGLMLRADAFFSAAVFLRGVLPALLIPPSMMLLCLPHLLVRPREQKRDPKPKKAKAPFSGRGAARVFGFGGRLEHTLGKRQFRSRTRLTVVLTVNLSVLVLLTAGFSVLGTAVERWNPVCEIELCYAYEPADADGEAFHRAVQDLLRGCEEEGLADGVTYIRDSGWWIARFSSEDLDPVVAAAEQRPYDNNGSFPVLSPNLFRLSDGDCLINTSVNVMDDASFDRLLLEYGIPRTEDGAVICNSCLYCSEPMAKTYTSEDIELLRAIPADGVTVYPIPSDGAAITDLFSSVCLSGAQVFTLPEEAGSILEESTSATLKIAGGLPVEYSFLFNFVQAVFSGGGSIFVPERMEACLPAVSTGRTREFVQISASNSEAVIDRVRELDGQYGYIVSESALGDGTYRYVYSPGSLTVVDHPAQQRQFSDFLRLIQSLYSVFILLCFVMIGLNVVNVVHMNRVARRREYAILTSIGVSAAERRGMSFYESFRITVRAVIFSAILLIPAAYSAAYVLNSSLLYDNLKITAFDWIRNENTEGLLNNVRITVKALLLAVSPYLWLVAVAVGLLFFGFALSDLLADRRFEKTELIAALKDDMYE